MLVKSEPFHIQAYKQIHKNLLENVYSPGEKLTETSLATQLGVSRAPIREAIRILIHEGLLVQKGVHTYVYAPTIEDAKEVFLCREKLEPFGAGLAALHMNDSEKEKLIEILDLTKTALKNEASNSEIAKLNSNFHEHIALSSKNKQLIQIMQLILGKSSYLRNVLLGDYKRKDTFTEEHSKIVDAIVKGDQLQAEKTMKMHLESDINKWEEMLSERKTIKR